jgi:nicotinate phosphoribosyltransferase
VGWTIQSASPEEILSGRVTDVYFERTERTLRARGRADARVVVEVRALKLPVGREHAHLGGVEEALGFLGACGVSLDVEVPPEGTLFRAGDPVMSLEGRYLDLCRHETPLLGFLCQASGVITAAAGCRRAAGDRLLVSFGARRMHPCLAPMVDRNAWCGGCDGVSALLSAERLGLEASGTMPHALVIVLGDTVEAAEAFDEVLPEGVPRVVLVDTFADERFESVRVAEALGDRLDAVRLDTTGSRRGDLAAILRETRWELDLHGHRQVKLFASGGLDEDAIRALAPHCDGFGVGGAIAAAPPVDFSLDIVEVDGKPLSKRGKRSGAKTLWRCSACRRHATTLRGAEIDACECGAFYEPLTRAAMKDGKPVAEESATTTRQRVLDELAWLDDAEPDPPRV